MKNQVMKCIALCAIVCGLFANANAQTAPAGAPTTAPMMGKMTPDQRVEMKLNKMKSNLSLTDAQTAQVKTLLQTEATARASGNKDQMKEANEKMKAGMSTILTPEQMEKYKQMGQQQMGKMHMNGAQPETK